MEYCSVSVQVFHFQQIKGLTFLDLNSQEGQGMFMRIFVALHQICIFDKPNKNDSTQS
jgi:hypothetical protein